MTEKEIDVLGTAYRVVICTEKDDSRLHNMDGLCDASAKECIIDSFETVKNDPDAMKYLDMQTRKVIRHELIHAFLYESGLAECSAWAQNEEMVDWIARQFPKLHKAFAQADAL